MKLYVLLDEADGIFPKHKSVPLKKSLKTHTMLFCRQYLLETHRDVITSAFPCKAKGSLFGMTANVVLKGP